MKGIRNREGKAAKRNLRCGSTAEGRGRYQGVGSTQRFKELVLFFWGRGRCGSTS